MLVAGVDIGSSTAKSVILEGDQIVSMAFIPTGPNSAETASMTMQKALDVKGLALDDLAYIVSTGYGRISVPFAGKTITEISCHAKGIVHLFPDVRTILDMGGQDCKAIRCDENGNVQDFLMNDKCAAGTGRYFERVSAALEVPLDDIGPLSLKTVDGAAAISSFCTVFTQFDVVSLLRQGRHLNDILAGVCEAMAERIQVLLKRVGLVPEFSITGGVAKNVGVVNRLERNLAMKARIAPEPLIIGALGAALFAGELAG